MTTEGLISKLSLSHKGRRVSSWRLSLTTLLMVLPMCESSLSASTIPDRLLGQWRLAGVYKTNNVRGMYPDEKNKLLGTVVAIDSNSLSACGQKIDIQTVDVSRIKSDDLLDLYHVNFKNLGIKDESVTRVVINNNESGNCLGSSTLPGEESYLKSHNEICINLDGVIFRAVRVHRRPVDRNNMRSIN